MSKKKRQTIAVDSFEEAVHLTVLADFDLRHQRVGAYILKKQNLYQFVFGFEFDGFHPWMGKTEFENFFERLEQGLKDFPHGESLTIYYSDFRSAKARERELDELWQKCRNEEIQLLLQSQKVRAKELAKAGKRRDKRIYLFATYTVGESTAEAAQASWVEKVVAQLFGVFEKAAGTNQLAQEQFETLCRHAFQDGYLRWQQYLSVTLGWSVQALRHDDLWRHLWQRLNRSEAPPVPQVIRVTSLGLQESINSQVHPATLLCQEEEPIADDRWVHLKGRYIGVLTLVDKPGGWPDKWRQFRYLWDVVLAKEQNFDIEIVAEISRANERLVTESVRRLLAQSLNASSIAQEAGTLDVGAQLRAEKAVEAQAQILEGAVPFWLGLTFLVHRTSLSDLDDACRFIEASFLAPAWVEREKFISWKIWLQTLPITLERLLTKPHNRRLLFLHSEVIGLLPLIKPQSADTRGLELISDEGFSPLFVDMFSAPQHAMLLAMTRRGKSVLATWLWLLFLAHNYGVTILDYPRGDGTSTFSDICNLLGGAYIDIMRESINCMEYPDFSYIPEAKRASFIDDYRAFIKNLFFTVVMGTAKENYTTHLGTQVRAIISIGVDKFYDDPDIRERIIESRHRPEIAPTGLDFYKFLLSDRIQVENLGDIREAFTFIDLRLQRFLNSAIGKAICSQRSSVPRDNLLTVFAFTNVTNDEDAAILSLVALTAGVRNSLKYERSLFFVDEAPILFTFDAVSDCIGRLCANGAKAGVSVLISAQDPDTIAKSSSGTKILQAMSAFLIGGIQDTAVPSFVKYLQYDEALISQNAGKLFLPKKKEMCSMWLLDYQGHKTICRYYPGILQLALTANNPSEQRLRDEILQKHTNKYQGYRELCKAFLERAQR
ncbi:MAG: hypothetical protein NZ482_01850 [Gloeomargarita sp. SKYG98]|nr:hypothetical protein [Gloeomargarita sp. SKYG98]